MSKTIDDATNVFHVNKYDGGHEIVTLAPKLAEYSAYLEYDAAGNATVTISHKVRGTVLDMSLDNGEIFEIEENFGNE